MSSKMRASKLSMQAHQRDCALGNCTKFRDVSSKSATEARSKFKKRKKKR